MEKFTVHTGVAVPLNSANIDTDQIIPKQFLLATTRKGFGKHAFHDWRYLDDEEKVLNPDFNLNKPAYQGASILVAQDNFGNGSSREHAPWALTDFGFRAVIAPYPGTQITISLEDMTVECAGKTYKFDLDPFYRHCLLNGLDSIDLTLEHNDAISAFEHKAQTYLVQH